MLCDGNVDCDLTWDDEDEGINHCCKIFQLFYFKSLTVYVYRDRVYNTCYNIVIQIFNVRI